MAKSKKAQSQSPVAEANGFPVPFTLEAFRNDVLEVFLLYVRTIAWMTDEDTAVAILGRPPNVSGVLRFESAYDVGLDYDHIRHTRFATAMERLYEYGCYGRIDVSAEEMAYESIYMWVADIVADARNGNVSAQWDSYGVTTDASASRCCHIAELANARVCLEGNEMFSHFYTGPATNDAVDGEAGKLTIRQMALLAGMEEMSIRAAANPKRANALQTYSDNGRTRVTCDVAKAWLQAKGRYVPITRHSSSAEIDLAKRHFTNTDDLMQALSARYLQIGKREGYEQINTKLEEAGLITIGFGFQIPNKNLFTDETAMRRFAELMELPGDLFFLRVREAVALEQLARVEAELRQIARSESTFVSASK